MFSRRWCGDPLGYAVGKTREDAERAGPVVLCTPEYAGALPGAFKNALDRAVGSTVFTGKPVAWIKVAADSRRGDGVHAELATVLGYLQARMLAEACLEVPVDRDAVDGDGLIADDSTIRAVTGAIYHGAGRYRRDRVGVNQGSPGGVWFDGTGRTELGPGVKRHDRCVQGRRNGAGS